MHCLSTLLEYEESMLAWEEAKDSGELDSDGSSSEDEDEVARLRAKGPAAQRRAATDHITWHCTEF